MKIEFSDEQLFQLVASISDNPMKDGVAIAAIEAEIQRLNEGLADRLRSVALLALSRADFSGLD